jgi:hypothetical protein
MGKPEPAAASSSPSARLRIQSLKPSANLGELLLGLSDGSSFLIPRSAAAALEPGSELAAEEVSRLAELDRAIRLHERALRLLAGAAHSARHPEGAGPLQAGLERRGVGRELAAQAVRQALTAEAERAAASSLVEKLRRRSDMTPERLRATLSRRGFRGAIIRELLGE